MSVSHTVPTPICDRKMLQLPDGCLSIAPRLAAKILEGCAFSVSHRFEGVASGASEDVYFGNPAGSGVSLYVAVIEVVSFAQAWVDIYRGNDVVSPGTALEPMNLHLGHTRSSAARVEYGGTYGTGKRAHSTVCPGGSRIRAVGGIVEVGETVVLPEGHDLLVRVTNKSASAADFSVRIIWWEE